ncbi:hypothetical protein Ancab_007265 [Ancistrocladus abbreviatus]
MMEMARRQTILLLLAWLLLAASQNHYTIIKVQATESVNFKLQPESSLRSASEYDHPTRVEQKILRKAPSGPNPIGNQHPPSRP